MNTQTKRATSVGISLGAIGAIIVGSVAFASSVSPTTEPTPSPTVSVAPLGIVPAPIPADAVERRAADAAADEAARIEAERLAAEAEAARVAAEAEAARIAAEQEAAARQTESRTVTEQSAPSNPYPAPAEPDPAPAPAPLKTCPGGTTAVEYDGAGNAVGCMDPGCFEGTIEGNDPRCVVVRP